MSYGLTLRWMPEGRDVPWDVEKIQRWPLSSHRVVEGVTGLLVEQNCRTWYRLRNMIGVRHYMQ
ncbi:MAG: hypothetical protein P8K08_04040 [Fuerstiella sp.]|nr:hypothetical protein [Fuerstiella sp.]